MLASIDVQGTDLAGNMSGKSYDKLRQVRDDSTQMFMAMETQLELLTDGQTMSNYVSTMVYRIFAR